MLESAGSIWTVNDDGNGLSRRVDPIVQAAFEMAVNASDEASVELAEAWTNAYGRHPDASDTWDYAIKAAEHALRPVVMPADHGATLGRVLGALKAQPHRRALLLRDNGIRDCIDPLATLEQLLHFIWPNPDRHGGANKRTPSLEASQAVVQLAVLIVQWVRAGVIS